MTRRSNQIYSKTLALLATQDELLSELYDELATLDKEMQGGIEGFIKDLGATVGRAEEVGKGCRATIANAVSGGSLLRPDNLEEGIDGLPEEKKAVEVVSIGFEGKKPRKSDETLVGSDAADEVEE